MATFTLRVTSSATNTAGTGFSTPGNQQADLGAPSFYDVQISNSTDPVGMPNGIYDAWCLDPEVVIRVQTDYNAHHECSLHPQLVVV